MSILKWILWFFVWRARRLFGLIFLASIAKPVGRFLLRILNIVSGFVGALLKLGVKNPDVHGTMLGIVLSLSIRLVDWQSPLGQRGYLSALGACLFTIFLLDAISFELIREQEKDEELAKRIRKAFRESMWITPLLSELLGWYVFKGEAHLIQVLVELWMKSGEILNQVLLWLLGGPPGEP